MSDAAAIDFDHLWRFVIDQFELGPKTHHGPDHWQRVEQNGLRLAESTGADEVLVRLFALFHDCRRLNETVDRWHGARAAKQVAAWHGELFELAEERLDTLLFACRHHNDGLTSTDPTVGTCWDADRLDLPRVGIRPEARYMSTAAGRREAAALGNLTGGWG